MELGGCRIDLDRRAIAERGVKRLAVVEDLDKLKQRGPSFLDVVPGGFLDELLLQSAEKLSTTRRCRCRLFRVCR